MEEQLLLFDDNAEVFGEKKRRAEVFSDYAGFVDKFKPKKTTDDCYTPQAVMDAVVSFVRDIADIDGAEIVRPFWPGSDYQAANYPDGCVVIDNPPFSILAQIIRYFCANGIRFFLFAPALTLFTARDCDVSYIIADSNITYENGAVVRTGFITNLLEDIRIWCCPRLKKSIEAAQAVPSKVKKGFVYPDNIVTAATLGKITAHDTELIIRKISCFAISDSDGAKAAGRSLFGGGYLLSERAAAERAAAERAAAERAAAERAAAERAAAERAAATHIKLSAREIEIIKQLGINENT